MRSPAPGGVSLRSAGHHGSVATYPRSSSAACKPEGREGGGPTKYHLLASSPARRPSPPRLWAINLLCQGCVARSGAAISWVSALKNVPRSLDVLLDGRPHPREGQALQPAACGRPCPPEGVQGGLAWAGRGPPTLQDGQAAVLQSGTGLCVDPCRTQAPPPPKPPTCPDWCPCVRRAHTLPRPTSLQAAAPCCYQHCTSARRPPVTLRRGARARAWAPPPPPPRPRCLQPALPLDVRRGRAGACRPPGPGQQQGKASRVAGGGGW